MIVCPSCGKQVPTRLSPKWQDPASRLLAELKAKYGESTFTGRDTVKLAKETLGLDTYQAWRLWEAMRQSGLLEGVDPRTVYRKWRLSCPPESQGGESQG